MSRSLLQRIADGRTDLVFELLALGEPADAKDAAGVSLLQWCAYYGDVSAMRLLLSRGVALASLGVNHDLNGAAFHGHWRLCQFLLERGADANLPLADSGETPLHAALSKPGRAAEDHLVRVLLAAGADPNATTLPGAETGAFMRDCRTRGETPLHRAAAFGTEATIQLLVEAGARLDARDQHGDTPLSWASWYLRPAAVLRRLCYGDFRLHANYAGMEAHLQGLP